jgi:hypothetical protein
MDQKTENVLRISLSCNTLNLPIGTSVRINDDLEIAPINRVADPNYIGRIIANYYNDTVYTVTTKYNHRYDKAVAGVDSLVVGPGVHGPDGKIYPFVSASPGYHAGTVAGPFTFAAGSTDVLSVQVNTETAQTFTLVNGTAQAVCDLVNADAVDFVLSVTPAGGIAVSAVNTDDTITIGTDTHTCNAVLGLTAAAYAPTAGSHGSPTCMIISGGDAGDLIEILED